MRFLRLRPRSQLDESAAYVSDRTLVAAAATDLTAFDALFTRHWDGVYRYCFYRRGHREDAEDAALQVLTKVHANLGKFSDANDSFRSWLFTIAHNEVMNRRRYSDRHLESPLEQAEGISDPSPSPEDRAITTVHNEETWRTLEQLTQRPRQVVELRLAGLSDREIATVLGIGHDAVRQAQSRALAQLRVAMSVGATGTEVRGVYPIDDVELNRFWNELVAGRPPTDGYGLSADDVRLLSDFHMRGTRPQSGSARERARQQAHVRIEANRVEREDPMNATTANPANLAGLSSNGRAAAARREPQRSGALGRHRWATSGFARLATAALLLLVIFGGYRAFDPFGSKSPSSIPAAVFSAATPSTSVASPTPTPYPRTDHLIIGVWKWVLSPIPSDCCLYAIFEPDGSYVGIDDAAMGPGTGTAVMIGEWRATGERTVELVTFGQSRVSMDFMFEPDFTAPDSVLTGNPVTTFQTLEIDATGNAFTAEGYGEPRNADGSVAVHLEFEYTISPQAVRVAGSWETQLPPPTPAP